MKKYYTNKKLLYFNNLFSVALFAVLFLCFGNNAAFSANVVAEENGTTTSALILQQENVSLNRKDANIVEILKEIQKQSNFSFVFEKNITPETMGKFTISVKNVTVNEALRQLFVNTQYTYKIDGKSIVISEKKQPVKKATEVIEIKGLVVDSDKKPLAGVMVLVTNSPSGAITDSDGRFNIKASPTDKLEFSYVGFKTEVIPVVKASTGNMVVSMKEDVMEVDDVVVVAYGTQTKESLVGSVTTVNTRQLKSSSSDLTSTFAGNIAGMVGWQTGGMPGAMTEEELNTKFYIRGITSFQTGANIDPLILIDGVESSKLDLSRMSTDDIESFSVLKDASATAMYGARGANGVILVTTKKGKEGSVYTSVRYEVVSSRPTREIEVVDPRDYMKMYNRALLSRDPNATPQYSVEKIDRTGSTDYPSWVYPENDWYDILFKDFSVNHRAGANIRGGSKLVQYYASINYSRDEGMLKTDRLNQFKVNIINNSFSFRTNLNIDLTSGIRLTLTASANMDNSKGPYQDVKEAYYLAFNASPVDYAPIYPGDATYGWPHLRFGAYNSSETENPYRQIHQGYNDRKRYSSATRIEYIHNLSPLLKGLEARASVSTRQTGYYVNAYKTKPYKYRLRDYDFETGEHTLSLLNEQEASRILSKDGAKSMSTQGTQVSYEGRLLHTAGWNDHQTSVIAVFSGQESTTSDARSVLDGIPNRNLGFSMRGSYGYKNRYFAEASFGYNGSERFAKEHRYGFFPSLGGAWVLSKENFIANSSAANWLSFFKMRFSWGQVGNDGIINDPRFTHLPTFGRDGSEHPGPSGAPITRPVITSYPNNKITWEIAEQMNIGLELGFFDGLVELNADLYQEVRHNILDYRYTMPDVIGLESLQIGNVGSAKSNGIDLSGKIQHAFSSDLWVIFNGTFTYSKAVFKNIEESTNKPYWQIKKGQEISQQVGYIAEGLFRDEAEIANSPIQGGNLMPGDIRYRDLNGDGIVDVNDATHIGYPTTPRVIYGFNGFINYKSFEFSFAFQGSGKRSFFMDPMAIAPFVNQRAMLKAIADDHWSTTNMTEKPLWPRLSTQPISVSNPQEDWRSGKEPRYSTYFMREASFLRCTSMELGYNFKEKLLRKIKLQNLKFYARVNNPFLITNFKIWDVELGSDGFNYPIQRTWSVGVNVSF